MHPHSVVYCLKNIHRSHLENFGALPSLHLSIVREHPNCGLKPLNQYQEEAVKDALEKPFTLVQGPPGKYDINPKISIQFPQFLNLFGSVILLLRECLR